MKTPSDDRSAMPADFEPPPWAAGSPADRAAGVLLGLLAGDANGGPVRMAVRLAESLIERQGFDATDVAARYLHWAQNGGFDMGPTATAVLAHVGRGMALVEAVSAVDRACAGMTAGCNPAHRGAPLAAARCIPDDALDAVAIQEAALTHAHRLAGDVSAAVVSACRALIEGVPWPQALDIAATGRLPQTTHALRANGARSLRAGGVAPDALAAAVHFVGHNPDFASALRESVAFAGPANYCPVLVGAVGGARWGASQVSLPPRREPALVTRVRRAAARLGEQWA